MHALRAYVCPRCKKNSISTTGGLILKTVRMSFQTVQRTYQRLVSVCDFILGVFFVVTLRVE